jgi:hypothetical protein
MDMTRHWWFIRQYGAHLAITTTFMGSSFLTIFLYVKQPSIEVFFAGVFCIMSAVVAHGLWIYAHTKLSGWKPSSLKIPNVIAISGVGAGAFLSCGLIAHEISKGSPSPWFGVWLLLIGGTFTVGLLVWTIIVSLEQALKTR